MRKFAITVLGVCLSAGLGMADDKAAKEKDKDKGKGTTVTSPRDAASGQASGKTAAPRDQASGQASGKRESPSKQSSGQTSIPHSPTKQ